MLCFFNICFTYTAHLNTVHKKGLVFDEFSILSPILYIYRQTLLNSPNNENERGDYSGWPPSNERIPNRTEYKYMLTSYRTPFCLNKFGLGLQVYTTNNKRFLYVRT